MGGKGSSAEREREREREKNSGAPKPPNRLSMIIIITYHHPYVAPEVVVYIAYNVRVEY